MTATSVEAAEPERVAIGEGTVTLESLDQLAQRQTALEGQAQTAESQADQLTAEARSRLVEAGTILAAQRSGWDTSAVAEDLTALDGFTSHIDAIDAQLAELSRRSRHGLSGFFARFSDRQERARAIAARNAAAANVHAVLENIAFKGPASTVPGADQLIGPARETLRQADSLRQRAQADRAAAAALDEELTRRRAAMKQLGFDALWTAAWLQNHEPPPIDSPVAVKKGEQAWLVTPCSLARMATRTQWVGGSQGISFPIGHTGIRYRVGSYRGHPVESTSIRTIDTGSLVLTNQRLVFVGATKSVTIQLSHVVHVEAYTDALAVFQDRKESPDFFKLESPQYVLFYLNYALGRLTS